MHLPNRNKFLHQTFYDNIEKITYETQDLIMMVIEYKKFDIDFKLKILEKLFQKISKNVNFGYNEKNNPLIMLCHTSNTNIEEKFKLIIFLVEKIKVDINRLSDNHTTAIMYAYQENKIEIVKYLLFKGALVKYTLSNGTIINIFKHGTEENNKIVTEMLMDSHSEKFKEITIVINKN